MVSARHIYLNTRRVFEVDLESFDREICDICTARRKPTIAYAGSVREVDGLHKEGLSDNFGVSNYKVWSDCQWYDEGDFKFLVFKNRNK